MSTLSVSRITTADNTTPLSLSTSNASAGLIKLESTNTDILINGIVKFSNGISNLSLTSPAISNPTITDPTITGAIAEDVYTITDGAAFEIDPGNGTLQNVTLGASRTPKATNFAAGESVTIRIKDGTSYTITWTDTTFGTSGVSWVGGSAPTLDPTNWTVVVLWKEGTQVYGKFIGVVV